MKLMRLFVIGCLTVVLGGVRAIEDAPEIFLGVPIKQFAW